MAWKEGRRRSVKSIEVGCNGMWHRVVMGVVRQAEVRRIGCVGIGIGTLPLSTHHCTVE